MSSRDVQQTRKHRVKMISVSCVTSPGQIWLVIGQLDTIQPSLWLLPADGDLVSGIIDVTVRGSCLRSDESESVDPMTTPSLYSASVFTVHKAYHTVLSWTVLTRVKQCSRVLPHSQLSDQTALTRETLINLSGS